MCWGRILFERQRRSNNTTSPVRVIGESVPLLIAYGARIQQITELIETCTVPAIEERKYSYRWRGRAPRSPRDDTATSGRPGAGGPGVVRLSPAGRDPGAGDRGRRVADRLDRALVPVRPARTGQP